MSSNYILKELLLQTFKLLLSSDVLFYLGKFASYYVIHIPS